MFFKRKSKVSKFLKDTLHESQTEIFIEEWRHYVNGGQHNEGYAIISYYKQGRSFTPVCIHIPFLSDSSLISLLTSVKEMKKGFIDADRPQLRFIYHTDKVYLEILLEEVPNSTFFAIPSKLSDNLISARAVKITFRQGEYLYEPSFIMNPEFVSRSDYLKDRTTDYYEFIRRCLNYRYIYNRSTDVVILTNPEFEGTIINAFFEDETKAFLNSLSGVKPYLSFNTIRRTTMTAKGMKSIWDFIHRKPEQAHHFPKDPNRLYLIPVDAELNFVSKGDIMDRKKCPAEILAFCANGDYQLLHYEPRRFTEESAYQYPVPVYNPNIHV